VRPLPFASTIDESGLHCVDHRSGGCAPSKIAVTNNKKNNRMQIPSNSAFECTNALLVLLMEKKEGQKKNSEARIASPHLAPLLLPSIRGDIGAPAAGVPISSAIVFLFSPGVLALRGVRRLSPSILRRKKNRKGLAGKQFLAAEGEHTRFFVFFEPPALPRNGPTKWAMRLAQIRPTTIYDK